MYYFCLFWIFKLLEVEKIIFICLFVSLFYPSNIRGRFIYPITYYYAQESFIEIKIIICQRKYICHYKASLVLPQLL